MDEEILWILRKLAAREIPARSADRILRALELLRKTEGDRVSRGSITAEQEVSAEATQVEQEVAPAEGSTEAASQVEVEEMSIQALEKLEQTVVDAESTESWQAAGSETPIESISDGVDAEGAGEAEEGTEVLVSDGSETYEAQESAWGALEEYARDLEEESLESNVAAAIAEEEASPESEIDLEEELEPQEEEPVGEGEEQETETTSEDMASSDMASQALGTLNKDGSNLASSNTGGDIIGEVLLRDDGTGIIDDIPDDAELVLEKAGDVVIQGWDQSHIRAEGKAGSATFLKVGNSLRMESDDNLTLYVPPLRKISIDLTCNMSLEAKSNSLEVDGFSGEVRVRAKDTSISLRNSGDAEIHIESDGGDIDIEDCYADVYVESGTGDVRVSGSGLSFGGMGKVDLKMKAGDAYLHRRSFEDIQIVLEEGNVELNMERLSFGGSGQINVYKGDITTRVLPSFGCELIARGSRKRMYIELPVAVVDKDKNQLHGLLNGGGSRMELIAPNGEIRFQALETPDG